MKPTSTSTPTPSAPSTLPPIVAEVNGQRIPVGPVHFEAPRNRRVYGREQGKAPKLTDFRKTTLVNVSVPIGDFTWHGRVDLEYDPESMQTITDSRQVYRFPDGYTFGKPKGIVQVPESYKAAYLAAVRDAMNLNRGLIQRETLAALRQLSMRPGARRASSGAPGTQGEDSQGHTAAAFLTAEALAEFSEAGEAKPEGGSEGGSNA